MAGPLASTTAYEILANLTVLTGRLALKELHPNVAHGGTDSSATGTHQAATQGFDSG